MRQFLLSLCLVIAVFASTPAFAANDSRAFPPDNCSAGSPFMGFTGVNGSNTFCNSGQDILTNALITNGTNGCSAGQELAFDNGKFICRTVATCTTSQTLAFDGHNWICQQNPNVPTCQPGSFLTFNGQQYECKSTGVATCNDNQVLTFNGTSYYCVNRTDAIPVCGANQFLTYNGSYQCANVITPAIPSCPAGQVVTGNGSSLSCTAVATAPTCPSGQVLTGSGSGQMTCVPAASAFGTCELDSFTNPSYPSYTYYGHRNKDGRVIEDVGLKGGNYGWLQANGWSQSAAQNKETGWQDLDTQNVNTSTCTQDTSGGTNCYTCINGNWTHDTYTAPPAPQTMAPGG